MGSETVAVLGMGRMGGAMAGTLHRAGLDVVVWNRTRSRAESMAREMGVDAVETARGAAEKAPIVLSSLADDTAVLDAYSGPDGGAAGLQQGAVVLEMSTIDPRTLDELQPLVADRGATLLEGADPEPLPDADRAG